MTLIILNLNTYSCFFYCFAVRVLLKGFFKNIVVSTVRKLSCTTTGNFLSLSLNFIALDIKICSNSFVRLASFVAIRSSNLSLRYSELHVALQCLQYFFFFFETLLLNMIKALKSCIHRYYLQVLFFDSSYFSVVWKR